MSACKKTRAMAAWAEKRRYKTTIIERRFPGNLQLDDGDPRLALCGIDNALGRQKLEDVGFGLVSEAGLGIGERYLNIDHHVFPGTRRAEEVWRDITIQNGAEHLIKQPGYQTIAARGEADECGLLQLASKSVGVPFVGTAAATLVLAAACRHVCGGTRMHQISLNLSTPEEPRIFADASTDEAFNPGFQKTVTH